MTWLAPRGPTKWGRRLSSAAVGGVPQGPHAVGTAPLLRRRGGRVVAYATTPESCQGRRAKRALTRFVPGGHAPPDRDRTSRQTPCSRGACPPDKQLRPQIGPEAFTNLRLQCPLQGMALSGSLYTDGVPVQVRSTTRGPASRVGPDDAIGPPHKPDQSALACLLTAAHARPDGLTSALGRHR